MTKGNVNWAIVGLGDIVRKRVGSAILQQPNSRVYACVTRNPDARQEDLETLRPTKVFTDIAEMLADEDVDAVYLATPVDLHAPQAIAALEAGKYVLVEKPMALDSSQTKQMCNAAQKSGRNLAVAYYRRFWGRFGLVKDMIGRNKFGQVVVVHMRLSDWYCPGPSDPEAWRVKRKQSGGGVLMDVGSHRLDLLAWWFGLPQRIVAHVQTQTHNYEVDDSAAILGVLPGGVQFAATFNWNSKVAEDEIVILGTQAEVILRPCDGPAIITNSADGSNHELMPKPPNAHYPLIDDFARAIIEDRSPRFSGADGSKATQIMDAIFTSSTTNTWQELN